MIDVDKLHFKTSGLHHIAGAMGDELGRPLKPMLFQLMPHQPQCQGSAVHYGVELLKRKRQAADVVLVAVGQKIPRSFPWFFTT